MGIITAIVQFFKIVSFFLNLKSENNKQKAEEKSKIGKEIVDALKQTNKNLRAAHLNSVVGKLRK